MLIVKLVNITKDQDDTALSNGNLKNVPNMGVKGRLCQDLTVFPEM